MPEPSVTDFDARAETWDGEDKIKRAAEIATTIQRTVPLNRSMRALEYGAGTGLLSFSLRDSLRQITLADSSAGMRTVAERKIAAAGARHMRVINLDLMRDAVPAERYDFIFSMTVLHHVPDVPRAFAAFHAMLDPGGWLCHVDLDAEDGSFHGPTVDVHHGFERGTLWTWLSETGFVDIAIGDCGSIEHGGRHYPLFIATARNP